MDTADGPVCCGYVLVLFGIRSNGIDPKEGQAYVKQIPVRRVLNVLLQFECAMGLFLVYRYVSGAHYGWKKILLSLAGWESIGNSNWYVFCILWLYIFTFVSFRIWKTNYGRAVIGVALLSLAYSAVLHQMGYAGGIIGLN